MGIAVGLLALVLVGAEGDTRFAAPVASPQMAPARLAWYEKGQPQVPRTISYQYHVIEMQGVDWRGSIHGRLQPVVRQGNATVWTAGHDVSKWLLLRADKVLQAPRITATEETPAHIAMRSPHPFVSDMVAADQDDAIQHTALARPTPAKKEGPVSCNTQCLKITDPELEAQGMGSCPIRFSHDMKRLKMTDFEDSHAPNEAIRTGFTATCVGRRLDQGVLVRLVIDDTQVIAMHPVTVSDMSSSEGKSAELRKCSFEVPELAQTEVAGEWLIPKNGVLVVSLGAHTVADATGKAVVREKLVLLEPVRADAPGVEPDVRASRWQIPPQPNPVRQPEPSPVPEARHNPVPGAPMPALPSRTLPQPHDAKGPIPLPPLPEEPAAPATLPGSSDPCATPQTRPAPESTQRGLGAQTVDPDSLKVKLDTPPVPPPPPATTSKDNAGKLTVSVVFEKPLSGLTLPSASALRQVAQVVNSALNLSQIVAGKSADAETSILPIGRLLLDDIRLFGATSPASPPEASSEKKEDNVRQSSAEEIKPSPGGGVWTPARPNVLRIPVHGATVEIRVTPSMK